MATWYMATAKVRGVGEDGNDGDDGGGFGGADSSGGVDTLTCVNQFSTDSQRPGGAAVSPAT